MCPLIVCPILLTSNPPFSNRQLNVGVTNMIICLSIYLPVCRPVVAFSDDVGSYIQPTGIVQENRTGQKLTKRMSSSYKYNLDEQRATKLGRFGCKVNPKFQK